MIRYLINKLMAKRLREMPSHDEPEAPFKLSRNLKQNLTHLKEMFGDSNDIIIREFAFGKDLEFEAIIIYVDGLIDTRNLNQNIVEPLMYGTRMIDRTGKIKNMDSLKNLMVTVGEVNVTDKIDDLIYAFMSGDVMLLVDGFAEGLDINCKGWDKRSISEPQTESVIRGPREGFIESIRSNTSLLRRKIKDPAFLIETMVIGRKTKTYVAIAYIKGVANTDVIKTVKERLKGINTDAILESGYIEEYIEDAPFSIFATVAFSEKPDIVAAKILEGRVGILVDGTPFVLTVPTLFMESFQSSEDYYTRPYYATMLRVLRIMSYLISILGPAIYVALVTFHQELIPTPLLFTIAQALEGTPFPSLLEALIMLLAFEILREAGVRLPKPIGQAISIVGALVMGEAAVSAGLIGAPMVIVIAITAVSSFTVPMQAEAGSILRILLLVLAGTMGGFGIMIGLLGTLIHLVSMESFGMPFLKPLAPMHLSDQKDFLVRSPMWMMITRPWGFARRDKRRQSFNIPPNDNNKK